MVSDQAEDALIEISNLWRSKRNDDASERKRFHCSLCLREAEQVVFIGDELECRWHVVVVLHVDKSVC